MHGLLVGGIRDCNALFVMFNPSAISESKGHIILVAHHRPSLSGIDRLNQEGRQREQAPGEGDGDGRQVV